MFDLFKRVLSVSAAIAMMFGIADKSVDLTASAADNDFESYMSAQGFPESYRPYLRQMHSAHPNWIFTAQQTGLDWNYVLSEECVLGRNLVHSGAPDSWKSCEQGAYDAYNHRWYSFDGDWVAASSGIIAYYLDPRNFINDNYIFMFENQSYNPDVHNISGVRNILNGTFMSGDYTTPDTWETLNYAATFMDAAQESGVSPYHLAARCRNEQGADGAPQSLGTVPGFENYFNFFDIQAYYTANYTAGQMGAMFAMTEDPTYLLPWTNQYKSIVGGSIYLGTGYITKQQDTLYLQKFDVFDGGNGLFYHQYMTCVFGQATEALEMRNAYSQAVLDSALEFKIPVYNNMPQSLCLQPGTTASNDNLLYRLDVITPDGTDMLPNFQKYSFVNDITVPSEVSYVTVTGFPYDNSAYVTGAGRIELDHGLNVIELYVTAASGDVRTYTLNITREQPPVQEDEPQPDNQQSDILRGDVDGNGIIEITDALEIMNYTSGKTEFDDDKFLRADVDDSGVIDIKDALKIMSYVSGKIDSL